MPDKTIVVTGVASGIGAETAELLKRQDYHVIGLDLQQPGPDADIDQFITIDLNDVASISRAAGQIDGPLHGLCNIAGLPPRADQESQVLQVNFLGTRALTAQLVGKMKYGASLVNVASRAGNAWAQNMEQVKALLNLSIDNKDALTQYIKHYGIDSTRAYNLSKEAMIVWSMSQTEVLLTRGIRINSVSPGAVDTHILDDFTRAFGEKVVRNVKRAGRAGKPAEIAELIGFLLSPASSWINGSDIPIDGGMGAFAVIDAFELIP